MMQPLILVGLGVVLVCVGIVLGGMLGMGKEE